jgi:acyl carrier protein
LTPNHEPKAATPRPLAQRVERRVTRLLRSVLDLPEGMDIKRTARIRQDLDLDELDVIELIMDLEGEFRCVIPKDEMDRVESVGGLIEYLTDRIERETAW